MIHPDRKDLVRTREMLAAAMGMPMGTFRNKKPYNRPGFPAPVSSAGARTMLWDGEQIAAFFAGAPVPVLPPDAGPSMLLDRQEAAAELGVAPRSWDKYAQNSQVALHRLEIHGVDHWPRAVVHAFRDSRPGKAAASGRPKGSTDAVPRGELRARVGALLDADPAVTIASVREATGAAYTSVQRLLAELRAERIEALMKARPALSFDQAADALGYPPAVRRGALSARQTTHHGPPAAG